MIFAGELMSHNSHYGAYHPSKTSPKGGLRAQSSTDGWADASGDPTEIRRNPIFIFWQRPTASEQGT